MTKSEQDLASILTSGVIRAKNSFGLARGLERLSGRCRAACFTEMPVSQISRLAGGGRCWGLAFKKNFIVENGGQRVWYVDSASELFGAASALKEEKLRAQEWNSAFWTLAPYIDQVIPGKYDFDWEREWRVVGDLKFELSDVALIITYDGSRHNFIEQLSFGFPVYNAVEGISRWEGGSMPSLGACQALILDRFSMEFLSPEEAGIPHDDEAGFFWSGCAKRYSSEEALQVIVPDMPSDVIGVLASELNQISMDWASRAEI
ncbi:hypothetical protein M3B92_12770 [Brevibacterium casei]|uniref:hypothetical protein n=1 Tax=Brevibacterium casei TaxID=33889 RepID=UPI00223AEA59|nr:hypothetical protein [Brevibacterium casei]MCT1766984.1 hypothetical protein [Brevibacterium casei]